MAIVPYDKRKELTAPIKPSQLLIITKRGVKQKDIMDNRVSLRRQKTNKAINQDITDLEDKNKYLIENVDEFKAQLKQKQEIIDSLNTIINNHSELYKKINILEQFRDMFVFKCIVKRGTLITILQCSGIIRRKECKLGGQCNERRGLTDKIF